MEAPPLAPPVPPPPGLTAAGLADLLASVLFFVSEGFPELPIERDPYIEEQAAREVARMARASSLVML